MRISILIAVAALALSSGSAFAAGTQCRDARGKFIKCPAPAVQCRDAKGHYAKCGTPGAKPAGVKTTATVKH